MSDQRPGCGERDADAQDDGHEAGFVVGILNRMIPTPRHFEQVDGNAERQQSADDQFSRCSTHGEDSNTPALTIASVFAMRAHD